MIYYLSWSLVEAELSYAHVKKLALAAVHTAQRLQHYLSLRKTYVVACLNPFQYILSRCMIGGKFAKWIIILQEFDWEFRSAKAKKSLIFVELLSYFPGNSEEVSYDESLVDGHLFLIHLSHLWYGLLIVYLQTTKFPSNVSKEERRHIRHQDKYYLIINDTLYRRGVDTVLRWCLTHEEAEKVLNDCHGGACGGHLSGLETTQKILRAGYFSPSLFKDCIEGVQKCHPCQMFSRKVHSHPAPMHPVIAIGPFSKWGIDFTTCHPPSTQGHRNIIVTVDYFTKWDKAMPTYLNDGKTVALFTFNHIIARFRVPKQLVTDHGSHFQNAMTIELSTQLGFRKEHSSPYYPQANGQVEVVNKTLKTILQ